MNDRYQPDRIREAAAAASDSGTLARIEAKLDWLHDYLVTEVRKPESLSAPWPGILTAERKAQLDELAAQQVAAAMAAAEEDVPHTPGTICRKPGCGQHHTDHSADRLNRPGAHGWYYDHREGPYPNKMRPANAHRNLDGPDEVWFIVDDNTEVALMPGHDYELITFIPGIDRKLASLWRLGYVGKSGPGADRLVFSGRGPDRATRDQYCGTQDIEPFHIVDLREVPRDDAARHRPAKVPFRSFAAGEASGDYPNHPALRRYQASAV